MVAKLFIELKNIYFRPPSMGCPGHLQHLPKHSSKEEQTEQTQHRAAADEQVWEGDEGEPEKVTRVRYYLTKFHDQGCVFKALFYLWSCSSPIIMSFSCLVSPDAGGPAIFDVNFHSLFIEVPSMVNFRIARVNFEAILLNFLFKQQTKQPMGWFVIMNFFENWPCSEPQ